MNVSLLLTYGLVMCNTSRSRAEDMLHIDDLLHAVPCTAMLSIPEHLGRQWLAAVGGPAVSLGLLLPM